MCDFGLCSKFDPKIELSDFCGSPGFFEPEMITKGSYFGDKADLWSAGCVFLEMIIGHETFSDTWMFAYDIDIVKVRGLFTDYIFQATSKLLEKLPQSSRVLDFIPSLLKLNSADRITVQQALHHCWFDSAPTVAVTIPSPDSISGISDISIEGSSMWDPHYQKCCVFKDKIPKIGRRGIQGSVCNELTPRPPTELPRLKQAFARKSSSD